MTISSVAPAAAPSTLGASGAPGPAAAGWQGLFAGLLGGASSGDQASATLADSSDQDASGEGTSAQDTSDAQPATGAVDILSAAQVMAAAQVVPVTPVLAAALNLATGGTAVVPGAPAAAVAGPVSGPVAAAPLTAVVPASTTPAVPTATPSTGSAAVSAGDPVPPPVASSAVPLAVPATTEVVTPPSATAAPASPADGPVAATASPGSAPATQSAAPATLPSGAAPTDDATGAPATAPTAPAAAAATVVRQSTPSATPAAASADASPTPGTPTSGQPTSEATTQPTGQPVSQSPGQQSGQPDGQGAGQQTPQDQGQTPVAVPQHASAHHRESSSEATASTAPASSVTSAVTAPLQTTSPVSRQHAVTHTQVTGQVFPEIARMVSRGDGTRRITLKLSPEALGDVRVTLTVRHGDVHVRMIGSEQAQQALRAGAGELQRLLEGTGASSGQIVVGDHSAADTGWQAGSGTGHHPEDHRPAGTRDGDTSARDGSSGGPQQRASTDPRAARGAITRTQPGVDVTM